MREQWKGFKGGNWCNRIDVKSFIQSNYTKYEGDDTFLETTTSKTKKVWKKCSELLKEELEKKVLDIDVEHMSGINSFDAGYIDKENEVIVGLQTDAPLKRMVNPYGGIRMVYQELEAYGYKLNENVNVDIGENMKQTFKNTGKFMSKISMLYIIIFGIIFLTIFGFIIFNNVKFFRRAEKIEDFNNSAINIKNDFTDNVEEKISESDIRSFNITFEMYSGTESKFFVEKLLDQIVTNNKTNKERVINVVYNEISITDAEKIIDFKHSLEDKDYEVILDYDEIGFVYQIRIEDI